jgi:hypothetical protein
MNILLHPDFHTHSILSLGYTPEVTLMGLMHVSVFMCIIKPPLGTYQFA